MYSHFFYHINRRKIDRVMSCLQNLHYVPWQQLHKRTVEELATLHPFK